VLWSVQERLDFRLAGPYKSAVFVGEIRNVCTITPSGLNAITAAELLDKRLDVILKVAPYPISWKTQNFAVFASAS
jgi:hypothetical protein